MYQEKKIGVIIAAAGSGTRMGGGISKQFRKIGKLPILTRSIGAFDVHPLVDEIIVVTKEDCLDFCREEMIAPFGFVKVRGVVAGGAHRQDSVYRGLLALSSDVDLVLIHDGARPFVSRQVIGETIRTAADKGAAVAAVPVKDTIKAAAPEGFFIHTPDRSHLYGVQTPQAFSLPILKQAMEKAFAENFYGTDDSVLVERLGQKVYLVESKYDNIKITTAEDLTAGEAIAAGIDAEEKEYSTAADRLSLRMGTGFDVHRLTEGRKLILGGVEIPWEKGLLGHSDADVLLHAVMDALLGAAALGDIGMHFPDRDEAYRGISSLELLKRVGTLLREKGYGVGNIDAVVIAQQPKIAPFIPRMREKIAGTLGISRDRISVKGTTTEGLGYCGRGEGIAAQAVACIVRL